MLYSGRIGEGQLARQVAAEADSRGWVRGHVGGRLTGVSFEIEPPAGEVLRGRTQHGGGEPIPFELCVLDGGAVLRGGVTGADTVLRRGPEGVLAAVGTTYTVALAWDEGQRLLRGEAGENWMIAPISGPAPAEGFGPRPVRARGRRPSTPLELAVGEGGDPLVAALIAVIALRG